MLQKFSSMGVSKKSIIFIYKSLVILSAGSMFFLLYEMIQTGIVGNNSENTFSVILSNYQAVTCLGWATFFHIILIKMGVYMKGGAKHDQLFFVHLVFAIMFTLLVSIMVFSYKEILPYLDIITLASSFSYTVVAFIGIPMLFKRF